MEIKTFEQRRVSVSVDLAGGSCFPEMSCEGSWGGISVRALRRGIGLAATPVFALMAVISSVYQDELSAICAGGPGALPLTGMVWMYVLMSVFHVGAWLRLLEDQQPRKVK